MNPLSSTMSGESSSMSQCHLYRLLSESEGYKTTPSGHKGIEFLMCMDPPLQKGNLLQTNDVISLMIWLDNGKSFVLFGKTRMNSVARFHATKTLFTQIQFISQIFAFSLCTLRNWNWLIQSNSLIRTQNSILPLSHSSRSTESGVNFFLYQNM